MVKWLKRRDCDRHYMFKTCSRRSVAYLGKTLYGIFPCLEILASSSKFQLYLYKTKKSKLKKFQPDSNILTYPEAGRGNCLPYVPVLALRRFHAGQEDKHRDKINKQLFTFNVCNSF